MKVNVLFFLMVASVATFAAFTIPDAGRSSSAPVSDVVFTNGWAISCTSTSLVFVAP